MDPKAGAWGATWVNTKHNSSEEGRAFRDQSLECGKAVLEGRRIELQIGKAEYNGPVSGKE